MDRRLVAAALVVLALAVGLWLKHHFSPAQQIKRSLERAAEAFEAERIIPALLPFFKGYRDSYGQDFETLAGNVKMAMDTYDDLDLELEIITLGREGDEYRMNLRFTLDGRYRSQRGHILGTLAEPCRATLVWAEKPNGWKIVTTQDLDVPGLRDELQSLHDPVVKAP